MCKVSEGYGSIGMRWILLTTSFLFRRLVNCDAAWSLGAAYASESEVREKREIEVAWKGFKKMSFLHSDRMFMRCEKYTKISPDGVHRVLARATFTRAVREEMLLVRESNIFNKD